VGTGLGIVVFAPFSEVMTGHHACWNCQLLMFALTVGCLQVIQLQGDQRKNVQDFLLNVSSIHQSTGYENEHQSCTEQTPLQVQFPGRNSMLFFPSLTSRCTDKYTTWCFGPAGEAGEEGSDQDPRILSSP
jgi:hypothetical protein